MGSLRNFAKYSVNKFKAIVQSTLLSYPNNVECNVCGWNGRHFLSDPWHKHVICPKCNSDIRQRLFFAALQNIEQLSFKKLIHNKNILHFAPEEIIRSSIKKLSPNYTTTDFLRHDCDLKLDMSNMPTINNDSFDVVIAFDVLEHVPDYEMALEEIHRIVSSKGFAIFTVPQKDNLLVTYDDPSIVTPEDRTKHYGQWDHLRIFGNDFSDIVENKGFTVVSVDGTMFSEVINNKNILYTPVLSKHPLATNHRKVFFCQKKT